MQLVPGVKAHEPGWRRMRICHTHQHTLSQPQEPEFELGIPLRFPFFSCVRANKRKSYENKWAAGSARDKEVNGKRQRRKWIFICRNMQQKPQPKSAKGAQTEKKRKQKEKATKIDSHKARLNVVRFSQWKSVWKMVRKQERRPREVLL